MAVHVSPMPSFEMEVHDDGALLLVTVSGELDMATVPGVREELERCAPGRRAIVLDLRGVTFMDSTAIRMLLELRRGAEGDRFAVVPPPGEVGRPLDLTGVRPLLRCVSEPRLAMAPRDDDRG